MMLPSFCGVTPRSDELESFFYFGHVCFIPRLYYKRAVSGADTAATSLRGIELP